MSGVSQVQIPELSWERFAEVLPEERFGDLRQAVESAADLLEGRAIWNVNSTATGGGVAEMLRSLIAYARGAGIDVRWAVIPGDPEFFRITKRIHNLLHGAPGDGGELSQEQAASYEKTLRPSIDEFEKLISPDDVVIVHDPQPAGLIPGLHKRAASIIWRCHVGLDTPNELSRKAWSFLLPYVESADAFVFSREAYAWESLDDAKVTVIPPSIDAFSPKNQDLTGEVVQSILATTGLSEGDATADPSFATWDGSSRRVERKTKLADGNGPPPVGVDTVVQVSRWDALKDPLGVIQGFVEHVVPNSDAHLILAGPEVEGVADDPEGAEVLAKAVEMHSGLSADVAGRVHLACIPMVDGDENAAIVNALQRSATVVVQKSLAEGFGLTVAEAMWKARPVVASRIGGIQDQIEHGKTGLLVDDPHDLQAYGAAVSSLLADPSGAAAMGAEAQNRVRESFLGARHLIQYLDLLTGLLVT